MLAGSKGAVGVLKTLQDLAAGADLGALRRTVGGGGHDGGGGNGNEGEDGKSRTKSAGERAYIRWDRGAKASAIIRSTVVRPR